jgi:hypothetical protein
MTVADRYQKKGKGKIVELSDYHQRCGESRSVKALGFTLLDLLPGKGTVFSTPVSIVWTKKLVDFGISSRSL